MTAIAPGRGRAPSRGQLVCCAALLILTVILLCEYSTFYSFPTFTVLESSSTRSTAEELGNSSHSTALIQEELAVNFGNKTKNLFLLGERLLPSTKNILFVETSCAIERKPPGGLRLTPKQACSLYSAARHNPTRKVVLLYTCPLSSTFYKESSDSVRTLFDLPNFTLAEVNLKDFYEDTPLAHVVDGPLQKSMYKVEHASDALRYAAVYFYGGTYMDLDVVSMKPLDDLGMNFIVAQEVAPAQPPIVASGVFNFEPEHGFTKECMLKLHKEYDPLKWSTIGPELVTKVLRDYCNLTIETRLDRVGTIPGCNITVWSPQAYYAINYWNWKEYYRDGAWPAVENLLSGAFGAHVWNHMGSPEVVIGGSQPYGMLAEKHCKAVYVRAGAYFRR